MSKLTTGAVPRVPASIFPDAVYVPDPDLVIVPWAVETTSMQRVSLPVSLKLKTLVRMQMPGTGTPALPA